VSDHVNEPLRPYNRKLIETSIPLVDINRESAREKSIRHGHPSTLHLWWARRPLAACRAVLFSQLVDDPSDTPDLSEEERERRRKTLHAIVSELAKWENINNHQLLETAREEIERSCNGKPPPIFDPFVGGGSIPLEAQRLGITAYASDLNPVAVLISKAVIEIPHKWSGRPPVFPGAATSRMLWPGATGMAEDVRRYGQWMCDEGRKADRVSLPESQAPRPHSGYGYRVDLGADRHLPESCLCRDDAASAILLAGQEGGQGALCRAYPCRPPGTLRNSRSANANVS